MQHMRYTFEILHTLGNPSARCPVRRKLEITVLEFCGTTMDKIFLCISLLCVISSFFQYRFQLGPQYNNLSLNVVHKINKNDSNWNAKYLLEWNYSSQVAYFCCISLWYYDPSSDLYKRCPTAKANWLGEIIKGNVVIKLRPQNKISDTNIETTIIVQCDTFAFWECFCAYIIDYICVMHIA